MRTPIPSAAACAVAGAVALWGCGSSGGASIIGPTPGAGGSTVVVTIVASSGNRAYVPNPVRAATGATIEWKNYSAETHHIVLDDGSVDLGEIAPGGSTMMQLKTSGSNFHCTLHRSMVGNINGPELPDDHQACLEENPVYDFSYCCDGFYC